MPASSECWQSLAIIRLEKCCVVITKKPLGFGDWAFDFFFSPNLRTNHDNRAIFLPDYSIA